MNDQERITNLLESLSLNGANFSKAVGCTPINVYHIKNGRHGISEKLAIRIVKAFPKVSMIWLMTGHGPMFLDGNKTGVPVPVFRSMKDKQPLGEAMIPGFHDCDFVLIVNGHSMAPVINCGDGIFCKWLTPGAKLFSSEYYYIELPDISVVRRVVTSNKGIELHTPTAITGTIQQTEIIRAALIVALYHKLSQ